MNEINFIDGKIKKINGDLEWVRTYKEKLEEERQNLKLCKKAILQNDGWKDEAKELLSKLIDQPTNSTNQEEKRCPQCKEYKSKNEFYKDRTRSDGLHHYCIKCTKEGVRESRRENKQNKTKVCSNCGETKDITDFYTHKAKKDGLQSYCIKCTKKRMKEYAEKRKVQKQDNHTNKPKGWCIFYKYLDEKWRNIKQMKIDLKSIFPLATNNTLDDYIKECKIYALDNFEYKYLTKQEGDGYLFKFSNIDVPISNGTKEDAIPLTDSGTKDRKTSVFWNKFKVRG